MVKSIVHIADLHFRTYKRLDEYREVCTTFFKDVRKQIADMGLEYNEVRIVIVGDLVHQKITISNELITELSWFLTTCAEIAPTVIVAGNHDLLENNKDRMDSITPIFTLLNNPNISYYKDRACFLDENIVWCNYSIFHGNQAPEIAEARTEYGDDKTYIGLFHAPILGAKTDLGFKFEDGAADGKSHFDGCDMVLLGDIHKRQVIEHEDIPIVYPSSLIQQNFGESFNKHGYLFWDVDNRTYTEHDVESEYGFYQFKIDSLDDLETNSETLTNA